MTILEMRPEARPGMRWTEVCAADHIAPVRRVRGQHLEQGSVKVRPTATLVAPGRRVLARRAHTDGVRACSVEAPSVSGVVDDVPTWVLVACGVAFGVILLFALAFLGGPAYA